MFCKWCGSSLSSSDTKCNRCGKEVPALSNCGGFYDLVPKARKPAAAAPTPPKPPVQNPPTPRQPLPKKESMSAKKRTGHANLLLAVAAGAAVLFLLLLVILFLLQGKVNHLTNEVEEMRDDLRDIVEFIIPDTDSEPTAPSNDFSDTTVPTGTTGTTAPADFIAPTDPVGSTVPTDPDDPIPGNTVSPIFPQPDDSNTDTPAPDAQQ